MAGFRAKANALELFWPLICIKERMMSLRKGSAPERGLSLLQGLTILGLVGVIVTIIVTSLGG
jgi:hypothetical protein